MNEVAARQEQAKVTVPLLDLKAQYAGLRDEITAAIAEVCDSQYFVLGPKVKELEEKVAEYSQCAHGIGVSSGTDALLVALMALEVGPGKAVITTPYTFFATGGTVSRLGARPIFCDIEPNTYNLSAASVQQFIDDHCEERSGQLIDSRTGDQVTTIMPVHLYGQTADMVGIGAIADKYGLSIVEDAAQSIGSEYLDGKRAGSAGHIGCYSFFPSKNLGAFGDGGMCATNDAELAERMRILRVHGGKPKYYHKLVGGNFRLDAIQAAILLVKLDYLDGWTAARQANAAYYNEQFASRGLGDAVVTPDASGGGRHIYNQYVIRVRDRDALREHLKAADIGTEIYYPVPLHIQECFSDLGYTAGDCPHAEKAALETVAVPVYPELSKGQMDHVVNSVAGFYGK